MIRAIVFSKDRPLQLDAFLRSIQLHAAGLYAETIVLWTASSAPFEIGYDRCKEAHRYDPRLLWLYQNDFRADLQALIPSAGIIAFHCDDDLFYRDHAPGLDELVLLWPTPGVDRLFSYSLRLGQNTDYCYTLDRPQRVPARNPWPWRDADCDFGYPFSLDGHLFRASLVRDLIAELSFDDPNRLEASGAFRVPNDPGHWGELLACGPYSCVVSVPANRVQDTCRNRHAGRPEWSAEALNERWLTGERLDLEAMDFSSVRAAHQEVELRFQAA